MVPGSETFDVLLADPPYSERTHAGHNKGVKIASSGTLDSAKRRDLSYGSFSLEDVRAFVDFWEPKIFGWMGIMSDDSLIIPWRTALEETGRLGFSALPCVMPGMTVRMAGDGPSSWCVHLNVARPRGEPYSKWGTLRGAYRYSSDRGHIGGKPLEMMRSIVRDYSKRDDLIVDPCCGWGTTILAALHEGRNAIGCEIDPATFGKAVDRIRQELQRGVTPPLRF